MTETSAPLPLFRERWPWRGGDLQTIRNLVRGNRGTAGLPPGETLDFAMADGDRLVGTLHRPAAATTRPLAILVHGLAGSEDSDYVVATAAHLLAAGHRVLRLNLRGAGRSRAQCRDGYHAGRSADFAAVLAALPGDLAADGVVAVGYSLGGNMLLKHVGERGAESGLAAAIAVSAPIDLAAASRRFRAPRNALYQRWLLGHMKAEALAPGGVALDARERQAIRDARSVYDFDDRYVAPRHGFAGAGDYYAQCSAAGFLAGVVTPTLMIHADNDPWIPLAAYRDTGRLGNPALRIVLTRGGGHVGFHGARAVAGGRWHDGVIAAFLASVT